MTNMPAGDRRDGWQGPKTSQSDGCAPSACLQSGCGCEEHPSLEHRENPQLCSTVVVWEPAPQLT